MLKCEVHEGLCKIECSSNAQEVIAEIGCLIGAIYDALRNTDKDKACWFRMCVAELTADGGPVWGMAGEGTGTAIVIPVRKGEDAE